MSIRDQWAERDLEAGVRAVRHDEQGEEAQRREWLETRASCRLPAAQRLSDETRRGRARMLGIDPDPPADG